MISRIYERMGLKRKIIGAPGTGKWTDLPQSAQVDVRVNAEPSRAFMRVTRYGDDLAELVRFRLQELCLRRIDCIFLDLPLSDPAAQRFCGSLEMLGFFFAGVIPEAFNGDVFRLQYLNNVDLELNNVQIASGFGKELFDYVIKAQQT